MRGRAISAARAPVFVYLMWFSAGLMMFPAAMAVIERDFATSRAFVYGAMLVGFLSLLLTFATRSKRDRTQPREQLLTLVGAYAVLPVVLAVPLMMAVDVSLHEAWFEMVSAMTTTGATVLDQGQYVPRGAHMWRVLVGWFGGFFALVTASAVLAPMNLGGFEVRAPKSPQMIAGAGPGRQNSRNAIDQLIHFTFQFFPLYAGLTFLLFLGLMVAGDDEFVALCHAMSTLATSGISPISGLAGADSGVMGEMLIFVFFAFALARSTYRPTLLGAHRVRWIEDPEFRLGVVLILGAFGLLYARHWIGADVFEGDAADGLRAFWGTLFTAASFLTTTGFESQNWFLVAFWSGLQTPGIAMIGLAMIGGGVATTAGGVKLMRVYAMGQHMRREVQQLVLPHSVGSHVGHARQVLGQGAFIAWVLFMLFAMTMAASMVALALTGVQFETALVLTVAALSNCGPLSMVATESPLSFAYVPGSSQMILAIVMVAGRLEALAILALFNPELWRK